MLAVLALVAPPAWAEDAGQADLDKATQLKLTATTVTDLTDVIQLCQRAMKKGLDQNNATFAKNLLASTLVQRGQSYASKTFRSLLLEGNWQRDRKDALADLERGIGLNPQQPLALTLIARLQLLPEGDAQRAHQALDQAIALGEDDPPLRAEALVLRANTRSDPRQRLADLDQAVRLVPGDAAVLRARAATRADLEQHDAALEDLDKAIKLEPKQVLAYQLKALVLVKQKKLAEAVAVLEKARGIAPRNIDLSITEAQIYLRQSNFKAALEEMNRAVLLDANNLNLLLLRSAVYQQSGEKTKALADIDRVLALKPRIPGVMRDRALLLADLGKLDEALAQLQQLRAANPKDTLALLQLGMLHTSAKHYDQAVEAFSTVIAEHPDEWMAYRGRADAQLNLGNRAGAVADYEQGLKLRPADPGLLNNLAWVLATAPEDKLRDGQRALRLALEACKLSDYKEDYILSTLAAAYAEIGDFENARKWSAKSVELGSKEHLAELKKEVDSYQARKPWREALSAPADKKKEGPAKDTSPPEDKPEPPRKSGVRS
jgi:tetratricopeptide (TPR) repeat protein